MVDMTNRPAGPRRTLSQQLLLDAALRLLAERGADGVSVRGIAAQVGVAPNAVYTYFPDKAAVLQALVEQLFGRVNHERFTDPTVSWRDRIRALAVELRTELMAHPGAVHLVLASPLNGPNALAVGETMLGILADAGLGRDDAARGSYLLSAHMLGSIALDVAGLDHGGPPPSESERVAARRAACAAVPADRYPRTAAAAATIASHITTEQFLWGLDRILDGLAVHPPPACRAERVALP